MPNILERRDTGSKKEYLIQNDSDGIQSMDTMGFKTYNLFRLIPNGANGEKVKDICRQALG